MDAEKRVALELALENRLRADLDTLTVRPYVHYREAVMQRLATNRGATAPFFSVARVGVTVAVAVLFALAAAFTLLNLRGPSPAVSPTPIAASSTTPPASPSPTPSPSVAPVAFPDVTLVAGTSNGMVYRISGGQVVGSPVRACSGETAAVLALRPAPSGQSVLVVCGGTNTGVAVLVDIPSMTVRPGAQPVVPRDDVAAWAPDERSIALLQLGTCESGAPVCSVHVALWDVASGTTRVIRPDQALTFNLRWTAAGLSVSIPQGSQQGTLIWDGQAAWTSYSSRLLWIVDPSGSALLVEASTGSTAGRVWKRVAGQEQLLTPGGNVEWPLGLDGDRSIVSRDQPPAVAVVTYRAGQTEQVVPAPGLCLAAQQWDRWLICTSSGAAALAYSLDTSAFARQQIAGLDNFTTLAALLRR